jgi:hypothetical protein
VFDDGTITVASKKVALGRSLYFQKDKTGKLKNS